MSDNSGITIATIDQQGNLIVEHIFEDDVEKYVADNYLAGTVWGVVKTIEMKIFI